MRRERLRSQGRGSTFLHCIEQLEYVKICEHISLSALKINMIL